MTHQHMIKLLQTIATVTALGASLGAQAEEPRPSSAHFYDMGTQQITGVIQRPVAFVVESHQRAHFERLLRLKRSMAAAILESSKERALR